MAKNPAFVLVLEIGYIVDNRTVNTIQGLQEDVFNTKKEQNFWVVL